MSRNRRFDEVYYMKRMAMLSFSRRMRRNRRFDEVNYEKHEATINLRLAGSAISADSA